MQLDSVMVRCGTVADVKRLQRRGGEVWQEHGIIDTGGGVLWRFVLVKVPARAAIRLGLIVPGAECGELAEGVDEGAPAEGADEGAPAAVLAAGHPAARVRPPRRRGTPGPDGDAA